MQPAVANNNNNTKIPTGLQIDDLISSGGRKDLKELGKQAVDAMQILTSGNKEGELYSKEDLQRLYSKYVHKDGAVSLKLKRDFIWAIYNRVLELQKHKIPSNDNPAPSNQQAAALLDLSPLSSSLDDIQRDQHLEDFVADLSGRMRKVQISAGTSVMAGKKQRVQHVTTAGDVTGAVDEEKATEAIATLELLKKKMEARLAEANASKRTGSSTLDRHDSMSGASTISFASQLAVEPVELTSQELRTATLLSHLAYCPELASATIARHWSSYLPQDFCTPECEALLNRLTNLKSFGAEKGVQGLLAQDTPTSSCWIAFRGTDDALDCVHLMKGKLVGANGLPGRVHKGFADQFCAAVPIVSDYVSNAVKQHQSCQIFVTGHSLGGALATLYIAYLDNSNDSRCQKRATGIVFGSPRVGDAKFAQTFARNTAGSGSRLFRLNTFWDNMGSSIRKDDVPDLPLGKDIFCHVGHHLLLKADTLDNIPVANICDRLFHFMCTTAFGGPHAITGPRPFYLHAVFSLDIEDHTDELMKAAATACEEDANPCTPTRLEVLGVDKYFQQVSQDLSDSTSSYVSRRFWKLLPALLKGDYTRLGSEISHDVFIHFAKFYMSYHEQQPLLELN